MTFTIPAIGLHPFLIAFAAIMGLLAHYLKKIVESRAAGGKATFWAYWLENPYQTVLAFVTVAGTLAALWEVGQLNGVTAFACGYVSNSVAEIIGSRVPRA